MQNNIEIAKNRSGPAVLITGASTGIGAACALELDRLGWQVFAGIRDDQSGQRLAEQASPPLLPVRIDVTEAASVAAAAKTLGETLGARGLDGLVNNAGVAVPGPLEALPIDTIRHQLEVNVVGQIAVTQAVLPLLRRAAGRIVMMGSVSGLVSTPYLGPYAASKFALEAITDSLRVELRRWKIQVSIVEPGCVGTSIWDKAESTVQHFSETISPEMVQLYGKDIQAIERMTEKLAGLAMPVSRVVRVVVRALTARRPKTRYLVAPRARLLLPLLPFVTDRFLDWIIRRQIGLD